MNKISNMPPQKFRELVFLVLYSQDVHASEPEELFSTICHELKVSAKAVQAAWEKAEAISRLLPDIDAEISAASTSFDFFRIQKVELAVLRLSCYELLFEKKLALAIVIAEAKRLAKKFATPDGADFCQAILDAIAKTKAS